ncbi:hypothetical protein PM082_000293 [Marasmius tenuissimus]|nr:hypothetical protein PM082_000293 [Marasmius tenuissimus]
MIHWLDTRAPLFNFRHENHNFGEKSGLRQSNLPRLFKFSRKLAATNNENNGKRDPTPTQVSVQTQRESFNVVLQARV